MNHLVNTRTGDRFSDCGRYRYHLWRIDDASRPALTFIMLNPSNANATADDPTVTRCRRRAALLGYGGIHIVNLFALVSEDPQALYRGDVDPIGPDNDRTLGELIAHSATVACAWSKHGSLRGRDLAVLAQLHVGGVVPQVLKLNKDGTPRHPLYIRYTQTLTPWTPAHA